MLQYLPAGSLSCRFD